MELKVWTERDHFPSWDDCTESAYLMGLIHGGWERFPLGAYTVAEREALDAAGGPDPSDGGSTFDIVERGSRSRYGVALPKIAGGSADDIRAALSRAGTGLVIAGSYRGLAAGHPLRRWQPSFTGGHAVFVLGLGDRRVRWYDPLALAGHAGDLTDVDTVLRFAWTPSDARITNEGMFMFATVRDKVRFAEPVPFTFDVAVQIKGWKADGSTPAKTATYQSPTKARAAAIVRIDQSPDADRQPHGEFVEVADGTFAGLYVRRPQVALAPAPSDPAAGERQRWLDWLASAPK